VHRGGSFDPKSAKHGRGDVVGRGEVVASLACALAARVPDHVGDVRELGVERSGDLAGETVLAEGVAVIGEEDEERVLEEVQLGHLVEEVA
jgi:hypothetical protein